jgi:hypothetical protein
VFSVGILLRDYVLKFMISMCDFVGILLMDYMLKFMVSMCDFVEISMVTNVKLKIDIY